MTPLQNLHLFVLVCVRLVYPMCFLLHLSGWFSRNLYYFYGCLGPNVRATKAHWLQSHPQSNGLKGWGLRKVIRGLFKGQTDLPLPSAV